MCLQELYQAAAIATHHGLFSEAAARYEECLGLFGRIGSIGPQNGGNGLHVHLYNQLAEVRPYSNKISVFVVFSKAAHLTA